MTPSFSTIRRPLRALISASGRPIPPNAVTSSSWDPTVIESPTIANVSTSMIVFADVGGAAPTLPATTTSEPGGADDASRSGEQPVARSRTGVAPTNTRAIARVRTSMARQSGGWAATTVVNGPSVT